jgi:ketosteroid isomerase-like protein
MQDLDTFMSAYEQANNSHIWENVAPFIATDAVYWFTDGSYTGIVEIQAAVESTFSKIQDEIYRISDVLWPIRSDAVAVCTYHFSWEGTIDGVRQSGFGRGTNVLEKRDDKWQIVHEHLSR